MRKQLLLRIGTLVTVALLVAGITCIAGINILGNNVLSMTRNGFLANAENDVKNIIFDASNLFDKKLERLTNNFPGVMTFFTEETFRNDYSFGYRPSYYNWPDSAPDTFLDLRYHANISYSVSSINVYNKTIYDLPYLSSSLKNTINRTAIMDYLFLPTFRLNSDFFAGYIGTTEKFLRYYPYAINNTDLKRYIAYNPVSDDAWYQPALAAAGSFVYTSPYYDPIAAQLMISITRTFNNPQTGALLGAFGSDLILATLQEDIRELTYLPNSRTFLFEKETGYLIADNGSTLNRLQTYNQISGITISSSLWETLKVNQQSFQVSGDRYFLSRDLATSQGQYMLVVTLDQSTILDTFTTVLTSINEIRNINVIIVVAVFVGMFLLTSLLVICLVDRLVGTLQKLEDDSVTIVSNFGGDNLTKGIGALSEKSGFDEIDNLRRNFGLLLEQLRQPSAPATNQFYQKPMWTPAPPPPLTGFAIAPKTS